MTLSDSAVAELINKEFVACWESIRPVPKVNIDFGDGRTLTRTLGGNTVLYVCHPDGRVVDALPGVYTPGDFVKQIQEPLAFVKANPTGEVGLTAWHGARVTSAIKSEQMRTMLSKAFTESPLLAALGAQRVPGARLTPVAQQSAVAQQPDPLADPHASLAAVSARIEDVSKQPATIEQMAKRYLHMPEAKRPSREQLGKMIVERDSATNVRLVRPAVHLLFATWDQAPNVPQCRDAVYNQILHLKVDDAYLGLADALVPGTNLR